MPTPPDPDGAAPAAQPPRRTFFHWLTYALGAAAAALVGAPLIGYLLRSSEEPGPFVDLGPLSKFPLDQTRLVTFENPIRTPWDGIVANTNVFVRYQGKDDRQADKFLVLAVNCAFGVPRDVVSAVGAVSLPLSRRRVRRQRRAGLGPAPRGLFHCPWRVTNGKLEVQAPHFPTLQDTEKSPV